MKMINIFKHLKTVNEHRRLVRRYCFKIGLYAQGLTHDLSKYSPAEFLIGVKYYQGVRSPNVAERKDIGMSTAWMHHKGRNKHHYEYWVDFNESTGNYEPMPMPRRYFAEMVMDRIAACKVYKKNAYKDGDALAYFLEKDKKEFIHKDTYNDLLRILTMLKNEGEKKTLDYIKNVYLKGR